MPYLCLMPTLKDRRAGGINSGTPQEDRMAGLSMSHSGRQWFSPTIPDTEQARQGQQKKP